MLSPRNTFRATNAPVWALATSFAGIGENAGESRRGVVGMSDDGDRIGVKSANDPEEVGAPVPAGTVIGSDEATEAIVGIAPSVSRVRERGGVNDLLFPAEQYCVLWECECNPIGQIHSYLFILFYFIFIIIIWLYYNYDYPPRLVMIVVCHGPTSPVAPTSVTIKLPDDGRIIKLC